MMNLALQNQDKMEHFPASNDSRQEQQLQREATAKLINDVIDDCIPYIEKTAYLEALEKSPHLINKETDPIRFLKFEQWNIWAAAQRTVKYWEWKRTLFGDDRTFRSITDLTGAGALDHHEVNNVSTGFFANLRTGKDGNVYAFLNRPRGGCIPPVDSFDIKKKMRLFFHLLCVSVDLYYDNQDCFTIIENGSNETGLIFFNLIMNIIPSPTQNARDLINEAMPIRFVRMHIIFCPTNTNMFSLEKYIIPSFLKINTPILKGFISNLCFHYCSSPNEAVTILQQHRIPINCIPDVLGGSWSYDEFDEWFIKASLQVDPILDSSKLQQNCIQSTLTNDSFLFQSELSSCQSSSAFVGKIKIPPNLVEDMSHDSNNGDDVDMDDFVAFDEYFDYEDIISEASNTVDPLVNYSDAEAIKIATATNNGRSLHLQQVDSLSEWRNDRVESECDSTSSPNRSTSSLRNSSRNQQERWSEKFIKLCKYREKMGHCLVPQVYTENVALGAWVKRQRYQYKLMLEGKTSNMTVDRLKALNDMGFVWDSQSVAWGNQLYELQLFKEEFKHCNIPANYPRHPRLVSWVKNQRKQYKLYCENKPSSLTPERFVELQKLDFE